MDPPRTVRKAESNIADATSYPVYLDMHNNAKASFQILLDCDAGTVTATIEASTNNAETAANVPSGEWKDVTNATFGVVSLISAAAAATAEWVDDAGFLGGFNWVRVKIVAATGGTTGDYTINAKRWS
jgi:hypothetical protein